MTKSRALDHDALRTRALNAVILNVTDIPSDPPTEFPAHLEEQRGEVRRKLNEDVSRWIKKAARMVASAWHRQSRPVGTTRDRVIDAAKLLHRFSCVPRARVSSDARATFSHHPRFGSA